MDNRMVISEAIQYIRMATLYSATSFINYPDLLKSGKYINKHAQRVWLMIF